MSVLRVTSLNILSRVGTHIFLLKNFLEKYNFMHFEIIYFPENLKKILDFTSKLKSVGLP